LKILNFSLVSFPLHLVSCYIVFPLFMSPPKGKNELDERPIIDIYRKIEEDGYMEIDICFPLKTKLS
jgi:hypothetical protein